MLILICEFKVPSRIGRWGAELFMSMQINVMLYAIKTTQY